MTSVDQQGSWVQMVFEHHLNLRDRYPGTLQCLSPTYRSGSLSTVSHRINVDKTRDTVEETVFFYLEAY